MASPGPGNEKNGVCFRKSDLLGFEVLPMFASPSAKSPLSLSA
ncbi:hypothetical protein HMPREF0185_03358 [Brevundimonas diminuta 470-4]|nr:hypothetical protein HMPREF0185_03358 [Brevundimonas diminuta 470-4]